MKRNNRPAYITRRQQQRASLIRSAVHGALIALAAFVVMVMLLVIFGKEAKADPGHMHEVSAQAFLLCEQ